MSDTTVIGMPPGGVRMFLACNPWMLEVPKIRSFYLTGRHWAFEEADADKKSADWFRSFFDCWGLCLDAHARACFPAFTWEHYYAWKHGEGHQNIMGDPGYEAYCAKRMNSP